ncbi:hypothetical protein K461DRAFT_65517 [Myriangium duriaei CBS 260.36]|uniref:Uncharacterized protein n=1 Tax=Myriangium duriaei CBS 260.36 TaxID=1168546 RepID=A0A9P4IR54_9PEZI|nr:hypothetical protein K461DRAFT_65517 [Myriangium duriaei CBS 260.36]
MSVYGSDDLQILLETTIICPGSLSMDGSPTDCNLISAALNRRRILNFRSVGRRTRLRRFPLLAVLGAVGPVHWPLVYRTSRPPRESTTFHPVFQKIARHPCAHPVSRASWHFAGSVTSPNATGQVKCCAQSPSRGPFGRLCLPRMHCSTRRCQESAGPDPCSNAHVIEYANANANANVGPHREAQACMRPHY